MKVLLAVLVVVVVARVLVLSPSLSMNAVAHVIMRRGLVFILRVVA